jgi:hypothetical protein
VSAAATAAAVAASAAVSKNIDACRAVVYVSSNSTSWEACTGTSQFAFAADLLCVLCFIWCRNPSSVHAYGRQVGKAAAAAAAAAAATAVARACVAITGPAAGKHVSAACEMHQPHNGWLCGVWAYPSAATQPLCSCCISYAAVACLSAGGLKPGERQLRCLARTANS